MARGASKSNRGDKIGRGGTAQNIGPTENEPRRQRCLTRTIRREGTSGTIIAKNKGELPAYTLVRIKPGRTRTRFCWCCDFSATRRRLFRARVRRTPHFQARLPTSAAGPWLAAIGCNSIQDGVPSWRWRTDHEVRCPRSPAPSHEDGRAAFNRRVRRCRVPAGPPGYGAGKLRCGQGNDAGIFDMPWKIEWGYY